MDERDRAAPLQLGEDRSEPAIAQVRAAGIRHQRHPVEPEHVQRVLELRERSPHVWQWKRSEPTELLRMLASALGKVLVAAPCERARRAIITKVHAGGADRQDCHVDPGHVEVCERPVEAPLWGSMPPRAAPSSLEASQ
jgi:hypothetical protein